MITIELFGNPPPQMRPRFSRKNGKCFDAQHKEKEQARWQIKGQYREEPLTMPLLALIAFFLPIPASQSSIKKRQMLGGLIAPMKKPDLDNLVKFVLDCLNGIVIADDSQICELRTKKIYSASPGTLVRLVPLSNSKDELLNENLLRDS